MTKKEILDKLAEYGINASSKKSKRELEELLLSAESAVNTDELLHNGETNSDDEGNGYVLLYRIKGVERKLTLKTVDEAVKYARTHGYNDITIKKN